ncbi:tetratricopeptide repeat protein [Tropicibacter naphthalenivorans]|uniref:Lipoprotein NlpI n=1 Tax=Tropicibacter naphthalenivorans TaxID=441103 RepID=A0A0P1G0T5_9RHOB|nr:tetratricopeptide repeat protein [Tropicibacter naphthalenivorans]CUH75110.1 lipoprotein NlpI [Tropicibacter naphthalenivorans]SMC46644.1 Tetratricopeptide repeat-containing protein [Tropicibacter naphthalenivorans]
MTAWANRLCAGLVAIGLALPMGAGATGISGSYLAARQASFLGDYEAAAHYYGRALAFAPTKPELLERAILANISLGEMDDAAALARQMTANGYASELAQMAIIAQEAASGNFATVVEMIDAQQGVGPLGDGLVKAWALVGLGDMDGAMDSFDAVAQIQGLGPFAAYHRALALAATGQFQQADALLADDTAGGMVNTRRGVMARAEVLSQLGRNDEAVTLFARAFGQDVDPALAQMRSALEAGETLPFTHVTNAKDGMAEVFFTLAGALSSEGNNDLTLLYTRLAEHLRPTHVDAILLSAELLDQMQQHDLALAAYARVPSDHPSFHAAELGRAEALRKSGLEEDAITVLRGLTQSHGDLPIVWTTLADVYRADERFAEGVEAYTTAMGLFDEITERQWFLFYARGICQEREGNWPEAEADFRRALELNPEQPQVLNYLGYSLVEKQLKLDEALELIERAVAARPNSGYIVDSLGWVLYKLGRYEEAVPHMERAAELMPIDPIVNDHLGDVYWSVGRAREAEFMWKRALSFVDWEDAAEEADPELIKRKIEVGLDQVRIEEGLPPLESANAAD